MCSKISCTGLPKTLGRLLNRTSLAEASRWLFKGTYWTLQALKVSDLSQFSWNWGRYLVFCSVLHDLKYNTTLPNSCRGNQCSHLCLIVPNGHRCSCPDSSVMPAHKTKAEIICDAPIGEFLCFTLRFLEWLKMCKGEWEKCAHLRKKLSIE